MPAKPLSDAELQDAARLYQRHGSVVSAAREAGINESTFGHRIKQAEERGFLRRKHTKRPDPGAGLGAVEDQYQRRTAEDGSITVYSLSPQIRTLDELIAYAEVDTELFEVASHKAGTYQAQRAKDKGPGFETVTLYKIDATFRPRKDADQRASFRAFLDGLGDPRPLPAPKRAKSRSKRARPVLLELSLPDIHVGKLAWAPETGENYDIDLATGLYLRAIDGLTARFEHLRPQIGSILLPTGNDLLHIDSIENTTTAGTRQDLDSRWQKCFVAALDMLDDAIRRLREIAPVRIPIIPGNHDTMGTFHLGVALERRWRGDRHVDVDNAPTTRKYIRHGACLIGFTHGDKEKHADLPLIMAEERPKDYTACRWREWHLGHLHKSNLRVYTAGDTHKGVGVRILPSLSGTDAWHYQKGYVRGVRAAEAFAWHETDGLLLSGQWRPEPATDTEGAVA
ncbi:MAG: hypothetical protein AAGB48_08335 [Planctomycetota bacterium]